MIRDQPLPPERERITRQIKARRTGLVLKGLFAVVGVGIIAIAVVTYGLTSHPATSVLRSPAASVLRVAGYSECGSGVGDGSGLRQGTGFVAAPGTVVTDAHVIYGDRDPMVQAGGRARSGDGRRVRCGGRPGRPPDYRSASAALAARRSQDRDDGNVGRLPCPQLPVHRAGRDYRHGGQHPDRHHENAIGRPR